MNTFPNIANVGHYTLTLPRDTKAGHNYYFKITDSKNKDQVVLSPGFSVKRKMPLIAKSVLFCGIGAGVVIGLIKATESSTLDPIPEAPGHPN